MVLTPHDSWRTDEALKDNHRGRANSRMLPLPQAARATGPNPRWRDVRAFPRATGYFLTNVGLVQRGEEPNGVVAYEFIEAALQG